RCVLNRRLVFLSLGYGVMSARNLALIPVEYRNFNVENKTGSIEAGNVGVVQGRYQVPFAIGLGQVILTLGSSNPLLGGDQVRPLFQRLQLQVFLVEAQRGVGQLA